MLRTVINKVPFGSFTLIVVGLILYFTLWPDPLPDGTVFYFKGLDKIVHFIMFFVLASAAYFDVYRRKKSYIKPKTKAQLYIILFTVLFGAVTEIAQELMELGRSGSWGDMLADTIGSIMGVILSNVLFIRIYNLILRIK